MTTTKRRIVADHQNGRIVRFTMDAATRNTRGAGTRSRDAILNAVPIGHRLILADVWNGITRARDEVQAVATHYSTPLTPPNALTAEASSATLNLGNTYTGLAALKEYAGRVADALRSNGRAHDADELIADVEERLAEINGELERFHNAVGTDPATVRAAKAEALRNTADARIAAQIHRPRLYGAGSKPVSNDVMNELARKAWAPKR